jgi:hypothetical protein
VIASFLRDKKVANCAATTNVSNGGTDPAPDKKSKELSSSQRPFDMSKYRTRHIALKLQYDGSKYLGFASQLEGGSSDETVEKRLFHALMKVKLITSHKVRNLHTIPCSPQLYMNYISNMSRLYRNAGIRDADEQTKVSLP